jgi:hypothetical protein
MHRTLISRFCKHAGIACAIVVTSYKIKVPAALPVVILEVTKAAVKVDGSKHGV